MHPSKIDKNGECAGKKEETMVQNEELKNRAIIIVEMIENDECNWFKYFTGNS